jgi:hypothetical protein
MITFDTLNTIVTDLLNIIRSSKISRSESISKRQIEMWVHQYRSILIKQDIDKGKMPNPDYIQELPGLQLEVVDKSEGVDLGSGKYWLRTVLEIPKTIDFNFKPGFTYIGTIDGKEIQLVPESRVSWQQYKKYTADDNIAFLRGRKLYLSTVSPLLHISPRGIWEIPTEVMNFQNLHADYTFGGWDTKYPIPSNMIPTLKEMILKKELGITVQSYSDSTNDSASITQPNIEPKQ